VEVVVQICCLMLLLSLLQVKSGKGGAVSAEMCVGVDLSLKQTAFTGNSADSTPAYLDAGYGGALHIADLGSMGSCTLDDSVTFRSNMAGTVSEAGRDSKQQL
jgi:hypothetical protein